MYALNPFTIPQIRLVITESKSIALYIEVIYHVFLNKPENPCESSQSYSFTACIKNSLSHRIGCRLPWDKWSSTAIPICTSSQQLTEFEDLYEKIDTWEHQSIVNYTGCLPPCSYTEYQLASDQNPYGDTPGIRLRLSNSKVRKTTEKFIYPVESFVSEFGGALGLFLGFSFMMAWDMLASAIIYCFIQNSRYINYKI
jgi:hypothetical protein